MSSKIYYLGFLIITVLLGGIFLANRSQNEEGNKNFLTNPFPKSISAPNFVADAAGNYKAENSLFSATLPKSSNGKIIVFSKKEITFTPVGVQNVSANVSGGKITYQNVYSGSDIEYQTTQKGIKESIIIRSLDGAPKEFTYNFDAKDLKGEMSADNSITFTRISKEAPRDIPVSDGTVLKAEKAANFLPEHPQRFKIPSPVMIDADGKRSQARDVKVILSNNSLTLIPNIEWLKKAKFPVVLDPTVEATPEIIEELAEKRTETSKTFLNDDLSYASVIFQNPIHYSDGGQYKDIDRTFVDSSDPNYKYEVSTGIYTAKLKGSLTGANDINLEFENGDIGFSPVKIRWSNGEVLGSQANAAGQLSADKTKVTYSSVFGISGINLEAIYDNEKFLKETVINSSQSISAANHTNDNLEISFALSLPSDVDLKVNSKVWDKSSTVETQEEIPVLKEGEEVSVLRQAIVYGTDPKDREVIKVRLSKQNNQLILTKIISGSFLSSSSYPIRTDTTDTFYADTSDGYIQSHDDGGSHNEPYFDEELGEWVDVWVWDYDGSWPDVRQGSGVHTSKAANTSSNTLVAGLLVNNGIANELGYYAEESFIGFDTSSLGAGVSVSAVSLLIQTSGSKNGSPILKVRVFDFGTSVTTADWVPGADLNGNTLVATLDTGVHWGGQESFTSEAAFPGAINKTGSTRLVVASSGVESASTPGSHADALWNSADSVGTATDPRVSVTYTPAAPTPTPTPLPQVKVQGGVRIQGGTRLYSQ